MAKAGRDFEEAVFKFVAALDPSAQVLFDQKVPDRHTKTPRQVDVWINAKFGGHIPIAILVSCKEHGARLDIGDIGEFYAERESTGANMGVIYSSAGFTKPALEKARALGIQCCRLYRHQPSEIPEAIFLNYFSCFSRIQLTVEKPKDMKEITTWDALFDTRLGNDGETVLHVIHREFREGEKKAIEQKPVNRLFPLPWETHVSVPIAAKRVLAVAIRGSWRRFQARADAIRLNGSYCYQNSAFTGSQFSPAFDTWDPPGAGRTEMTEQQDPGPVSNGLFIPLGPDVQRVLRNHFAGKPLG